MIGLLLTITLLSCKNQNAQTQNPNSTTSSQINTTISVDEFEKKLNSNTNIQLVDVRTPQEFAQGHIKGALNYNIRSEDFESQISKLDKTKPVLVYCLSGGRSSSAATIMGNKGFSEIYNMYGGIMKWSAANKPLENENTSPQSKGLSLDDFNKMLKTEKYVLVDYNAKWCAPCKKMAPMLEALTDKKKDKLILLKIDADENKDLLKAKNIESIPILELYKDGKLIWKHEGEIDEAVLLNETKL